MLMDYQTYDPHPDLASLVKCYWTLKVPPPDEPQRQRIVPDGCIEMAFLFGDPIRRYLSDDEFVVGPRQVVIGQITRMATIEQVGSVDSFAIRFYPHGFASFVDMSLESLRDTEKGLEHFFGQEESRLLADSMDNAADAHERIDIAERFLRSRLSETPRVDAIVRKTIDAMIATKGSDAIKTLVEDGATRRHLERAFRKKVGISPKQLGKVIRLQAALRMMIAQEGESLTDVAYESEYYDQAHFIKDFKEFTGVTPKDFMGSEQLKLSTLFYS